MKIQQKKHKKLIRIGKTKTKQQQLNICLRKNWRKIDENYILCTFFTFQVIDFVDFFFLLLNMQFFLHMYSSQGIALFFRLHENSSDHQTTTHFACTVFLWYQITFWKTLKIVRKYQIIWLCTQLFIETTNSPFIPINRQSVFLCLDVHIIAT